MPRSNRARLLRGSPAAWMLALLGLNLAWRTLRYVQCWPMWGDEGFVAVNFGLRDWAGMTRPLDHLQIVPVGFLWLTLGLVKIAGLGEMVLRLIPYLAGVGGAVLIWRMARRWLGPAAGVCAMAIFAASYYPVRHAAEVKPYSMDLLVAAAMLHVAALLYVRMSEPHDRVVRRATAPGLWLGLIALFVVSVWVSYPAAFVGGGVVLVLGWRAMRQRRASLLGLVLISGLALTASFLGMYLTAGASQSTSVPGMWDIDAWREAYPPLTQPWRIPVWIVAKHAGNMSAYPNGGNHWGSTGTLLLVVAGSVALWRRGRGWLVLLLLSPLPLNLLAAAVKKYPYGDSARVAQHIAPAVCLLAGAGLAALLAAMVKPRRRAAAAVRVAAIVMAIVIVVCIAADVAKPYKREADALARKAVRDLAAVVEPGDAVAFFGSFNNAGWDDADPNGPDLRLYGGSAARLRYNLMRYGPWPIVWAPPAGSLPKTERGRTFLVLYHDTKAPFPAEWAQQYLDAAARQLGEAAPIIDRDLHDRGERIEVYCFGSDCPTSVDSP